MMKRRRTARSSRVVFCIAIMRRMIRRSLDETKENCKMSKSSPAPTVFFMMKRRRAASAIREEKKGKKRRKRKLGSDFFAVDFDLNPFYFE